MQRTKNGNLEIFDHPARIALDMARTRKGKKRSATEVVYIYSSTWLLAIESRDLSQAPQAKNKKMNVAKPEQIETNQNKLHGISLWWLCITFD